MTTISPNRRRRVRSGTAAFSALGAVLVVVVVLVWRAQIAAVFWQLAAPVYVVRNLLDASENARLRAALASTTALLADRELLYQENIYLKQKLGRTTTTRTILAGVIMHPPATAYDSLIIDAGGRDGIVQGDMVFAGGSAAIGTVSEVYTATSRVVLFSSPEQTYKAELLLSGSQSVPLSIEGQGGGSMRGEVPAATNARLGDAVVLVGVAGGFAGNISYIDSQDGESFKTVYVHLPVDLFSLQFVEIQKPL